MSSNMSRTITSLCRIDARAETAWPINLFRAAAPYALDKFDITSGMRRRYDPAG